jgi:DNA-binding transcriptional LysR family regulator
MELRHLRYFIAVAEERNFSRAAEKLHVSQPPLSRQIRDLEVELGVKLLDRNRQGVRLTRLGNAVLAKARALIRDADSFKTEAKVLDKEIHEELRIGYAPSPTALIISKVLAKYHELTPGGRITLQDLTHTEILRGLKTRKLRAALTLRPREQEMRGLRFEMISRHRVGIVSSTESPFASTGTVRPSSVTKQELIVYRAKDFPGRSKILDSQIGQLDGLGKIWETTLQLPELSSAAPKIPQRVQHIIELVDRTRHSAEALRQRDLILQGRVLEATARLQAIAPAFEQAQINATKNLFVQDSPPIWSLGIDQWKEASQASFIPPASAALLKIYLQREPALLYLQAALIFFFFLSLSWRGVEKWTEEEPSLRSEAPVFDLPVSTAITLSFLVLGSLYSTAPFLLRAILWGVLLISITFILRRLVDRALFPMLDALIVLYFVDQFRLLSSLLPLVGRLLFGIEMLGATLFLI